MASDPRSERAARARQTGAEHTSQLSGLTAAFAEAAQLGPQIWALQQALLDVVFRSQHLEATRLSAHHGKDDPRVAGAAERAQRLNDFGVAAATRMTEAARFTQDSLRASTFHGYVV